MAHTRDTPCDNAHSDIAPKSTAKGASKPVTKRKCSHNAANIAIVEPGQPGPAKKPKTVVSKTKRQVDIDDTPIAEPEQAAPAKRVRTVTGNMEKDPKALNCQSPPWRSNRAQTKTQAPPQKRKRRTREEIAADKAKADAEKRRQEELIEENRRAMMQLDIDEDVDRANTAARTVRTFADLEQADTDLDGEEFEGFHDVSSTTDSESPSDGEAEDAAKLKVRFSI